MYHRLSRLGDSQVRNFKRRANRIKTLWAYAPPEWRNDFKLTLATVFCCIVLLIFFSADTLFGAVLLRTVYFQYGPLIVVILLGIWCLAVMTWAHIPFKALVVVIGVYLGVAGLLLTSARFVFLASYLAGALLSFSLVCFIPITFVTWLGIGVIVSLRGYFREFITDALLIRIFISGLLIFTGCYIALRHIDSLDFKVVDYQVVGTENYYSVTFTSISSDTSDDRANYICNSISVSCKEISEYS